MAQSLIHQRKLVNDNWVKATEPSHDLSGQDVLVSLSAWKASHAEWLKHSGRLGVCLEPNDDPADVAADLPKLAMVAVHFPVFTDGRGYSIGRLLRERYGYQGELRAVGDVMQDQIFYLSRVGFDAFLLKDGQSVEGAIAALNTFSEAYQASVERPAPLFRRRVG
jgi:uncharacterized protein (DUF934 family)